MFAFELLLLIAEKSTTATVESIRYWNMRFNLCGCNSRNTSLCIQFEWLSKVDSVPFQVKVWFQNRRMKHKRQTLSKTDEEDNKDSLKGDDDSQPCSEFSSFFLSHSENRENYFVFYTFEMKSFTKLKQLFRRCSYSRFEFEKIMPRMRITITWYSGFDI